MLFTGLELGLRNAQFGNTLLATFTGGFDPDSEKEIITKK